MGDTPFDSDPQRTYDYLVERLGLLKLAYLHCIEGQTRGENAPGAFDFQSPRQRMGVANIANNGFTGAIARDAIVSRGANMIAFGRPFISNPDLVERLRHGEPLEPEAGKELLYGEVRMAIPTGPSWLTTDRK